MLRIYSKFLSQIIRLLDIGFIVFSFVLGNWCNDQLLNRLDIPVRSILLSGSLELAIYISVWIFTSTEAKIYSSKRITPISRELGTLIKASYFPFTFTLIGNLVFKSETHTLNLIFFCLFNMAYLLSSRIALRTSLRFARTMGYNYRNIILVGKNKRSAALVKKLSEEKDFGLRIIGYVDETEDTVKNVQFPENLKYIGNFDDLNYVLNSNIVDEVFIALPIKSFYTKIEDIIDTCTEGGVGVRIISDMFTLKKTKTSIDRLDNIPLLNIAMGPDDTFRLFLKRCVDLCLTSLLLIAVAPVFIIVSCLIKLDSDGPVFFIQKRVGYNNRLFKLLKFRTMISTADAMKSELASRNEMSGLVFKIKNDPRITRIGKYLRRFSIDELPQFINVLKGEMSLVGPRPAVPEEVEKYSWKQRRRLSIKPGITGLWQTSGRNNLLFERWVELDLEYIDNWTLAQDFKILLKTIYVVLSGKGAM